MTHNKDLTIYYSSLAAPHCISCMCTRWDQNDWNITVETFLNKGSSQTLMDNTKPGAVGELYEVLGSKVHYDMTWEGKNTLKLSPNSNADSTLSDMRDDTIVYVKNLTTSPVRGAEGWINVKIEAVKSGSSV